VYEHNLVVDGALGPSSHLNYLQLGGDKVKVLVQFNTTYQPRPNAAPGEGFQLYGETVLVSAEFAYNTMIAGPGTLAMSYLLHGSGRTPITGIASLHDNYFDPTGAYGIFYPGTFNGWAFSSNHNMATGTALPNVSGGRR
jgi:hypothetical protein